MHVHWLERLMRPGTYGQREWRPDLIEAAARQDTTPWTIRRWVKRGLFPKPIYINNHTARWPVRVVEAFLLKRSTKRHQPVHQGAIRKQMEAAEGGK